MVSLQSLEHDHDDSGDNPIAYAQNKIASKMMQKDGINSVVYKLKSIEEFPRYTHFIVDLLPEPKYFLV